jgi:hypothetical protein
MDVTIEGLPNGRPTDLITRETLGDAITIAPMEVMLLSVPMDGY